MTSRDSLNDLSSALAAEATLALDFRGRPPEGKKGWFGDVDTMKKNMPRALVRAADGEAYYSITSTSAVRRVGGSFTTRLGSWEMAEGMGNNRSVEWVTDNLGEAVIKFFPGVEAGSSTRHPGLKCVIDGVAYTVGNY